MSVIVPLVYFAVLVFAGDALLSRRFSYVSLAHRLAVGLLAGLLLGTWATYLVALAVSDVVADPVAIGAVVSGAGLAIIAVVLRRIPPRTEPPRFRRPRALSAEWVVIGVFAALTTWMMLSTYNYSDGVLRIGRSVWSDFGPTAAIAQSFALGDNFPTEYPHYAGEPIRYHFLYYFQVGNLTHLGLDPASANNLLSASTLVAMLVVVIALGQTLFRSRAVGYIGAALFFFHGSLSFIPYLDKLGSAGRMFNDALKLEVPLPSGFPYRGEEWGIWTQLAFVNQRHLASAIGVLLMIVVFLLQAQRRDRADDPADALADPPTDDTPEAVVDAADPPAPDFRLGRLREHLDAGVTTARERLTVTVATARERIRSDVTNPSRVIRTTAADPALLGYILCGLLAGMLPLWNGAMFIAAAAVLGAWFLLFPNRPQMVVLAVTAAVVSVPQLLWVRPGTMAGAQTYPTLFWGYTIEKPTLLAVGTYLAFIFGPKLVLASAGLFLGTWRAARVFLAFTSLLVLAFLVQFSVEIFANHKFINAWLVVLNLFAAYAIVRLWDARPSIQVATRFAAASVALIIVAGGVIDLMPIKNQGYLEVKLTGDRLFDWVTTETEPTAVFLSDLYVVHPILLAGRRLYYGWPYYAWSAGYAVTARETEYRALFALRSPRELALRLQADHIDYVAFDDGLRDRGFAPILNEDLYPNNFEVAFVDPDNRYGHLAIYRVPSSAGAANALPEAAVAP
jgi:hypothetical protein